MARCPNCDALSTGVTRRCPECGHVAGATGALGTPRAGDRGRARDQNRSPGAKTTPAIDTDSFRPGAESRPAPEPPRRPARRTPSRIVLAIAAALVTVVAVGVTAVAGQRGDDPPAAAGRPKTPSQSPTPTASPTSLLGRSVTTNAVLVGAWRSGFVSVDIDSGKRTHLPYDSTVFEDVSPREFVGRVSRDSPAIAVGARFDGRVAILRYPFAHHDPVIAELDGVLQLVPSTGERDTFWVTNVSVADMTPDEAVLREYDFTGRALRSVPLPNVLPNFVTEAGIVGTSLDDESLNVYDLRTGAPRRTLSIGPADALAGHGTRVAWANTCLGQALPHCPLHVVDLRDDSERRIEPAYDGRSRWIAASFSPDGKTIAAFSHAMSRPGYELVVARENVDVAVPVPDAEIPDTSVSSLAWSPDGTWLFWATENDAAGAFNVEDSASVRVATTPYGGLHLLG